MRYCPLASRNDCDVLEMDCDVVLNVLLLFVVLEMDGDVVLNVLLLILVVVLEIDCDVVLDVLLLPLVLDVLLLLHAAAEHS